MKRLPSALVWQKAMLSLLVLGFAVSCGESPAPKSGELLTTDPDSGKADDLRDDPRFSCDVDEDCVLVPQTCCGTCGNTVSVNAWYAEEFALDLTCDGGQLCVSGDCERLEPACILGKCSDTMPSLPVTCDELDEVGCATNWQECEMLFAIPDDGSLCGPASVPREYFGCRQRDYCNLQYPMECARQPLSNKAYWFQGVCAPPGWEACEGVCSQISCAVRPEQYCDPSDGCVTIEGQQLRDACSDGSETFFAGCRHETRACEQRTTCALEQATGDVHMFETDCLPEGYDEVACAGLCADLCADLDKDACQASTACEAVIGTDTMEVHDPTFFACVPAGSCAGPARCAADPWSCRAWWFESGCAPAEFMACDGSCEPTPCSELSETVCDAAPQCRSMRGSVVEPVCTSPICADWYGGCTHARSCSQGTVCKVDPGSGFAVEFVDGCAPDAWDECE